jgi:hypothetical protein
MGDDSNGKCRRVLGNGSMERLRKKTNETDAKNTQLFFFFYAEKKNIVEAETAEKKKKKRKK